MLFKQPHTDVVSADWLSLRSSMVYHTIYHYSLALHVNHLLFLNTYVFGVFAIVASWASWLLMIPVCVIYATYALVLIRHVIVLPYLLVVGAMAYAACELDTFLKGEGMSNGDPNYHHLEIWEICFIGLGIVLTSFAFQLAGHATFETFVSPPKLFHGFVAAPILEYVSLLFRLGFLQELHAQVTEEVERSRLDAQPLIEQT